MAKSALSEREQLDAALKAMTVFTRSVDQVLGSGPVKAAGGGRMSASKVQLLKLLLHQGPRTQGRIARYLGVSAPAASQLADALTGERLVVRKPAKYDRRTTYLKLTAQGRKYILAVEREQRSRLRAAMRDSGTRSPAHWAASLEKIARSLAAISPEANGFCMQCPGHPDGGCVRTDGEPPCSFQEKAALDADRAT